MTAGIHPVSAQLIPDQSLGNESSVVLPAIPQPELPSLIQGGAVRGVHLFHSFQDFNVATGQKVYFGNPSGIEQIFSRVTGSTASQINGLLGVAGAADLFLLNPQGIVFGPNGKLEIAGSFVGTTATAFEFSDGQSFGLSSSTPTENVPLLTTTLQPGLQWGQSPSSEPGGKIVNRAVLSVGQDLQLIAPNLDLQGQFQVGGDLTLQANEQLQVRDQATAPFVAKAGQQLLLQGDRALEISALSHPNSQLVAGGDLILRSDNSINGDAQFRSGGSFRVQALNQNPGPFVSPADPVIRAGGDVSFTNYQGSSLHILSGGQVTAENITILSEAVGAVAEEFLRETIALSDDTVVNIDGSTRPTLDIRAGVSPAALGNALGSSGDSSGFVTAPSDNGSTTRADINLGNVTVAAPNGQVFLTNQYQPNSALTGGNITLNELQGNDQGDTRFIGNGTDLAVDSRLDFSLGNQVDVSSATGISGSINLLAQGDVRLDQSDLISQNTGTATAVQGGSISINAGNITLANGAELKTDVGATATGRAGEITLSGTQVQIMGGSGLEASTSGIGDGGNISIAATEKVNITGPDSYVRSYVESTGIGEAGDILIQAPEIEVDNAEIRSTSRPRNGDSGQGNAGNITFNAPNKILLVNDALIDASVDDNGTSAGSITIVTGIFEMSKQAQVVSFSDSTVPGTSQSENIEIRATESISIDSDSRVLALQGNNSTGNAGDIFMQSPAITLSNRSSILSFSNGQGNAGKITLLAENGTLEVTENAQIQSRVLDNGVGQAGDVLLQSPDVEIRDRRSEGNVQIFPLALPEGSISRDILRKLPDAEDAVEFLKVIYIIGQEGAAIASQSDGRGNASKVTVKAGEGRILVEDGGSIKSIIGRSGVGNAGEVRLEAGIVEALGQTFILSKAEPESNDSGQGNGGDLIINASEKILFSNGALVGTSIDNRGSFAGNVLIQTGKLEVTEGSEIFAVSNGSIESEINGGGNIEIIAKDSFTIMSQNQYRRSRIQTDLERDGLGNAGSISIQSPKIIVSGLANVTSRSLSQGSGGSITLQAEEGDIRIEDGALVAASIEQDGGGKGGNILLNANTITILGEQTEVNSRNRSREGGQGGDIQITGDRLTILEGGTIASSVEKGSIGDSGNILVQVRKLEANDFSFGTNTLGKGSAGDITIIATDSTRLEAGSVLAQVNSLGEGSAGDITIKTQDLKLLGGGRLVASTKGQGPGGNITVHVPGKALLTGRLPDNCTSNCESGFYSTVDAQAAENSLSRGGSITGFIGELVISNGARIDASSENKGSAGTIDLDVHTLDIASGGQLSSSTAIGEKEVIEERVKQIILTQGGVGGDIELSARDRITITDPKSGLLARTESQGNAGSIRLSTPSLRISEGGEVAASTAPAAQGHAGNIRINAGQADRLTIALQNGTITAETQSIGDGGDLIIQAPEAITIQGHGILTAQTSATGSAGNVSVTTDRLSIDKGTILSTTATANARPPANEDSRNANINLNANEMNLFGTVQVLSETQGSARAGQLTLQPNGGGNLTINLREESRVSASTSGTGQGGRLNLLAPKSLTISGQGSLSAETTGRGPAGAVRVEAQDFTLQNGAQLSTSGSGSGSSGNITINAGNRVTLGDRAKLTAETLGSGKAGNIDLATGQLELNDQAGITVRSINTGDGGNININATRPILMSNRSVIETDAGGSGNGGNIVITTPFLIALGNANADIIANAVSGDGGRISIDTQRLLNFEMKDGETRASLQSNNSNDISASSETGTSGTVALDTLNVDPSRGLAELPVDLTDPGDRITRSCRASSGENSFVTSGRGGVPQGPDAPLRSSAAPQGWITPSKEAVSQQPKVVIPTQSKTSESVEQITEVQGWERNSSGQVRLVVEKQEVHSGESTAAAKQVALNCKAEPVHATMPEHD